MTQRTLDFAQLDGELFFAKRLHEHGVTVLDGVATHAEKRERIRAAIIAREIESAILGKNKAGKTETYSQAFERFYGEPLTPKPKGKSHAET